MKFIAAFILLLSLLSMANCQKTQTKTENKPQIKVADTLDNKSLAKLLEVIKSKNIQNVELKDAEIVVGKSTVKVATTVEHDVFNQGQWFFAVRFETRLIGTNETLFTVGSIGISNDKKDAEQTSIDEWIGVFGTAFADMLAQSREFTVGDFKIYSGLMGIRGEKPAKGWMDGSPEMGKKIINALLPLFNKSNKEINSLNLMVSVNPNGEVNGECRLNNEVSPEVLAELKKLNWEKSEVGYLLKQFYLLKKPTSK